jgi:selenocysteine-specific elongation factor
VLQDPLPLQRGDRFVLRDAGRVVTLGGGEILDPLPSAARRNDPAHLTLLRALTGAGDALGALVGAAGDALGALVGAAGQLERVEALYRAGTSEVGAGVVELGSLLVSPAELARLTDKVTGLLEQHHATHPLEKGMSREAARAAVGLPPDAFDALIDLLAEVVQEGAAIRSAEHRVALDPQQEATRAHLIAAIDAGGFAPPLTDELEADPALLRTLVSSGELVRIGDFHLTGRRATEARSKVRARIEDGGPVTVADIRDLLGTTRKYAVPLCEWLDATGATRRQGDLRLLGPTP